MKRYRMLRVSELNSNAVVGAIVFGVRKYDYGLAQDDTRIAGKPHISVTLNSNGDYPFFTVPTDDIEELEAVS